MIKSITSSSDKSPDNKIFQNKLFYTYIKRQKSDDLDSKCDFIFYSLLF